MPKIEEYPLHTDYNKIFAVIEDLRVVDGQTAIKVKEFVLEIETTENRIIPALKTQACKKGEQALWKSSDSPGRKARDSWTWLMNGITWKQ